MVSIRLEVPKIVPKGSDPKFLHTRCNTIATLSINNLQYHYNKSHRQFEASKKTGLIAEAIITAKFTLINFQYHERSSSSSKFPRNSTNNQTPDDYYIQKYS